VTSTAQTVVVETTTGRIRGFVDAGAQAFLGIPYGAPPVGRRRFLPPVPATGWTGVRDAQEFGPTAPQASVAEAGGMRPEDPAAAARIAELMSLLAGMSGQEPAQSEDCLVLNVWTGGADPSRLRPVLVYLHGGAFSSGSGSWPLYNGAPLAGRGEAVVVTVNHRLGALGFLHLEDLYDGFAGSGNAGMLDLVLALEWVRDNIAAFGGDPARVLVMGSSGGASKSAVLLAMPAAAGLVHRANLMSGPMLTANPREVAAEVTERLLSRLGLPTRQVAALQDVPAARLVLEAEHLGTAISDGLASAASAAAFMPLQPVVDGTVLPTHPDPLLARTGHDVPVLIGSTRDDMTMMMLGQPWFGVLAREGLEQMAAAAFGDRAEPALLAYTRCHPEATPTELACAMVTDRVMWTGAVEWAEHKAGAAGAPAYVYRFDYATDAMGGALGATHGGDIPFALDNHRLSSMGGSRPGNARMGEVMSRTWIEFVSSGVPGHADLPTWRPYTVQDRATMLLDLPARLEVDPRSEVRQLYTSDR
jgi:para-nitrobenzyl esterase